MVLLVPKSNTGVSTCLLVDSKIQVLGFGGAISCQGWVVSPAIFVSEASSFADNESEHNYWLDYSSRPRTDQHPPSLRPRKEQEEPA